MAVSDAQWRDAAADRGVSLHELFTSIAKLDDDAPQDDWFVDREGDKLTLGQWAYLLDSRSYRCVCVTKLPTVHVITIWRGHLLVSPLFETSVFSKRRKGIRMARSELVLPPLEVVSHDTEVQARADHDQLAAKYR